MPGIDKTNKIKLAQGKSKTTQAPKKEKKEATKQKSDKFETSTKEPIKNIEKLFAGKSIGNYVYKISNESIVLRINEEGVKALLATIEKINAKPDHDDPSKANYTPDKEAKLQEIRVYGERKGYDSISESTQVFIRGIYSNGERTPKYRIGGERIYTGKESGSTSTLDKEKKEKAKKSGWERYEKANPSYKEDVGEVINVKALRKYLYKELQNAHKWTIKSIFKKKEHLIPYIDGVKANSHIKKALEGYTLTLSKKLINQMQKDGSLNKLFDLEDNEKIDSLDLVIDHIRDHLDLWQVQIVSHPQKRAKDGNGVIGFYKPYKVRGFPDLEKITITQKGFDKPLDKNERYKIGYEREPLGESALSNNSRKIIKELLQHYFHPETQRKIDDFRKKDRAHSDSLRYETNKLDLIHKKK